MRKLTDHKLPGLNDALEITVLDEPGHGGACHEYRVSWLPFGESDETVGEDELLVSFQNGPIKEHGVNGPSGEALLSILIDRQRCFQTGPFASSDNEIALQHLGAALEALQRRTKERLARGVEGTSQK